MRPPQICHTLLRQSFNPKNLPGLGWLLSLTFLLLFQTGCERFRSAPEIEFRTGTILRSNIVQGVTATGQLTPIRMVQVGSQISGIITEVNVDFNSRVREGEVLAKVDPASYERALTRAEADQDSADAQITLAEFNLRRAKELFTNQLISETEFIQTEVQLRQAQANLKMRKAATESCQVDLERTIILAPIDGVIISRGIEAGQTVAASFSTPTLFTIAHDLTRMQIELAVSEADIGAVDSGQRVEFTVDAFPTRKFEGEVRQVRFAAVTNQNVVTYTTVVEVDNPDLKLRPGMTTTATIVTAERDQSLRLPAAAIRFSPPPNTRMVAGKESEGKGSSTSAKAGGADGPDGFPPPPWSAERRRPLPEERDTWLAKLSPEQKQRYEEYIARMRQSMGGGPGGGRGRGAAASQPEGPITRTVYRWVPVKEAGREIPAVEAVTVKLGITDGAHYEVLDGLKEGDVVVIGTRTVGTATAGPAGGGAARSPLSGGGGGFGGPGRGGPPR
jgi:HlyD family secretion protein